MEAEVEANLATLHLDHARDLVATCTAWKEAMPAKLKTWHDGIEKDLVCQLLFGVEDHARAAKLAHVVSDCGAGAQHFIADRKSVV